MIFEDLKRIAAVIKPFKPDHISLYFYETSLKCAVLGMERV